MGRNSPALLYVPLRYVNTLKRSLPPATKFGQGYIFTGVCDSVHRGGGGLVPGGSPIFRGGLQLISGGVSKFSGGLNFSRGSPIFRGGLQSFFFNFFFFFFQFLFPQNFFWDAPTPPRRSMRGRYISYWNAFLFVAENGGEGEEGRSPPYEPKLFQFHVGFFTCWQE